MGIYSFVHLEISRFATTIWTTQIILLPPYRRSTPFDPTIDTPYAIGHIVAMTFHPELTSAGPTEVGAYEDWHLVRRTCDSFAQDDPQLSRRQVQAMKSLIRQIQRYDLHATNWSRSEMSTVMQHLSRRFFFDTITESYWGPYRRRIPGVHVTLHVEDVSVWEEGFRRAQPSLLGCYQDQTQRINIYRYHKVGDKWFKITRGRAIKVLVHEMIHAYLEIFRCRVPACQTKQYTTIGITGHGPIYQFLYTRVTNEIDLALPRSSPMNWDTTPDGTSYSLLYELQHSSQWRGSNRRWEETEHHDDLSVKDFKILGSSDVS